MAARIASGAGALSSEGVETSVPRVVAVASVVVGAPVGVLPCAVRVPSHVATLPAAYRTEMLARYILAASPKVACSRRKSSSCSSRSSTSASISFTSCMANP